MTLKKPRLSLIGSNNSEEDEDPSPTLGGLTINLNNLAADDMSSSPLYSPKAQEAPKPRNPLAELLIKLQKMKEN